MRFPDGSERIARKRRETLTGRGYSISVISNQLELADEISFETLKMIDLVRGYRNKVVHQDTRIECGSDHCREAIELALHLALDGTGLEIKPNFNRFIQGV